MAAMYEVGDVVTLDGGPGKPSEDWEVESVSGPTAWSPSAVVVRFRRVPEFMPGFFQWKPYDSDAPHQSVTWCYRDPNKGAAPGGQYVGRYVRVEVRDAE